MSSYVMSDLELSVPIRCICPNCNQELISAVKCSGHGKCIVDIWHKRKVSERTAQIIAQKQVLIGVDAIYNATTEELSRRVSGSCLSCKQAFPWNDIKATKHDSLIQNLVLFLLVGLSLVAVMWVVAMLATGSFTIEFLAYLAVAVCVGFACIKFIGIRDKKNKPTIEAQNQERMIKINSVPFDYLPHVAMEKGKLLRSCNVEWIYDCEDECYTDVIHNSMNEYKLLNK